MRYLRPALLLLMFTFPGEARAQAVEAGFQVTGLRLQKVGESPVGVGGRVLLHWNDHVALDFETDYFPENPSGNFGQLAVVAGARAGVRHESLGLFARARPGVIHFGGGFYDLRLAERTHFLMDVGVTLEHYPSPRTVLRLDLGDAIIRYGDTRLLTTPDPEPLGTTHNLQFAFGFAFRF